MNIFFAFAPVLGPLMRLCYSIVGNVGVAIIMFTVIVKVLMFPISVMQEKAKSLSQIFMPRVKEIQTRYRGNTQKMNEELMKLQKQGHKPAAGCFPMLLTMLILFAVLGVVYKPMTYFEKISVAEIDMLRDVALEVELNNFFEKLQAENENAIKIDLVTFRMEEGRGNAAARNRQTAVKEVSMRKFVKAHGEADDIDDDETLTDEEKEVLHEELAKKRLAFETDFTAQYNYVMRRTTQYTSPQSELAIIGVYFANLDAFTGINRETTEALQRLKERIVFMGVDFSQSPSIIFEEDVPFFSPILLIPILAFIFAVIQMIVMQKIQKKTSPEALEQMGAMRYSLYFLPIMSLVFPFTFPAGAGFYWAVSGATGILQSLIIVKLYPPEKMREKALETLEKKGYSFTENVVVIEKSDGKKSTKKESEMSQAERKEYYRKKLEEARQADLKKYGSVGSSGKSDDSDDE